ncbi:MAG: tRNA (adenosine(37)-N6)-threonylcarbamoyltransferase complex ATPase subunit type 1 TsaE [Acidobacteriota bacterium]
MTRRWQSTSTEETRALGRALADELSPDGVLLLSGDLGAGKTVLAQGIAEGLGIDSREVQSPTFTILREHAGTSSKFFHLDLYRLEPLDAVRLGLEELLSGPGVKVVEWAERLPFPLAGALKVTLVVTAEGARDLIESR